MRRASLLQPVLVAVICAQALMITWLAALYVPPVRRVDAELLHGFIQLGHGTGYWIAHWTVVATGPGPLSIAIALALTAIAFLRYSSRAGIVTALAIAGAFATAEILKPVLGTERFAAILGRLQVDPGSWPSGHATVATVMAAAAVVLLPRRWRPLVVLLGAVYVLTVSVALLIDAAHYPSDIIGGYILAAMWAALGCAFFRYWENIAAKVTAREADIQDVEVSGDETESVTSS